MSQAAGGDVRSAIVRGGQKGFASSWELIKVIAPVSIAVTALSHTPVLPWLSAVFEPLMRWLGLSGEAAVVLVAGNAIGLYSAIGAMTSLEFGPKELLILALMLSFSHNLLVETAVTKRLGVSYWGVMAYRIGLALVAAVVVNAVFGWLPTSVAVDVAPADAALGETVIVDAVPADAVPAAEVQSEQPVHTVQSVQSEQPATRNQGMIASATQWIWAVLTDAAGGLVQTIVLLVAIIIPLMVIIEALKVTGILEALSSRIQPYMGWLGMSGTAGFPLLAGFVFGLAYGAGVILEAAKENDLTQGDRRLLCVFLVACHAAVEDTVLFIPLGVNPFVLLGTRFALALLLTVAAARLGMSTERPNRPLQSV